MNSQTEFLNNNTQLRTKCQTWTRVMGYMRNIESFNVGKKSEFKQRVFFSKESFPKHN